MGEFGSKANYHKKELLNEMFCNLFKISLISHQLVITIVENISIFESAHVYLFHMKND
jgi:hypothetical protein